MNGPWFSRCGEKLNFARVAVDAAAADPAADPLRGAVRRAALVEAAVYHLQGAWHAFLNEVAENTGLGGNPVADAAELGARAAAAGVDSESLREIAGLAGAPESWLCALERAWQGSWRPRAVPPRAGDGGPGGTLLAVESADAPDAAPDLATCARWLEEMRRLVERLREGMEEW